ncbi:MAG: tRNA (adenosine(37)-N6)-threonylcarbamoyltransferase complex dimerization subunit type 1 TsaB [Actinomycetia bacterium]|nr:tRNA (adenosine(37)-N6)-threonylcarbamoyltransferase complex dimerization subunit type 1 TsaB [Actinomycetes bacterium]
MTSPYTEVTLAIDTAAGCSAGLAGAGEPTTRTLPDTRRHAEDLMGSILALLGDRALGLGDVTRIGVGLGPGPFTGLRVGIVTAHILGVALGVPVKGVCSLDVIAAAVAATGETREFLAVTDARRHEVYWAHYSSRDGRAVRVGEPAVGDPAGLPGLPVAGPGVARYPDMLGVRALPGAPATVDAGVLAACLDDLPDAGTEPLYLRKPDAELPGTRKSVLASGLRLPGMAPA